MDKIALFDFCETIVDFQTADAFCEFVKKYVHSNNCEWKLLRDFLNRTGLVKIVQLFYKDEYINKKLLLKEINGISKCKMEDLGKLYYEKVIKKHFIVEILGELNRLKTKGYKIYIVSGGYDIYIKHMVREYGLDGYISTELLFKNGVFCGKYVGHDCLGKEKVNRLREYFRVTGDITKLDSYSYSDSISDLPFLKFSKKGIVVSRKIEPTWVKENKLEVFLYGIEK